MNDFIYDTWMKHSESSEPDSTPVIVDIDEKSLEKLGQWPWPHTVIARLADKILNDGAAAIGMDIIFSEPDRTSPAVFKDQLRNNFGIALNLDSIPPELQDNDLYFSETIKNKPVVLGAFADKLVNPAGDDFPEHELSEETQDDKEETKDEDAPAGIFAIEHNSIPGAPETTAQLRTIQKFTVPLQILWNAAPIGFINSDFIDDRVIRSVPLLLNKGDNTYASLSLRTLMAAYGTEKLFLRSDNNGLSSITLENLSIPLEPDGTMRPFYRRTEKPYPYYSASDVLDNVIGREQLDGKIVFIGTSAPGLMDVRATPLNMNVPGVEIHATLIDNILSGRHISVPASEGFIQFIAIIAVALLAYALFGFLPALISVPFALLVIAGSLWGSFILFEKGTFITPLYIIMTLLLMGAFILPFRFWAEQKTKKQIKDAFGHYVSPEIVRRIAASDTKTLKGENREVSILFTDVRNFTTISEKMAPDQLVRMLNAYFTPMTACVRATGGTLDKFIGDALMAFWNAPLIVSQHQKKAVLAAMAMQKKLKILREKFKEEFGAEIKIGAGIHSGIVQVGSMGSDDLRNYTCIGDNVNLASRLESISKRYGAGIIVSRDIMEKCDGIKFRQLDRITVKGSSKPLDIFTPLEENSEVPSENEKLWEKGLTFYFQGNFAQAKKIYEKLLSTPEIKTAARLFFDRCGHLLKNPPDSWDGVWKYDSK